MVEAGNILQTWTEEAETNGIMQPHILEQDAYGNLRCRTCEEMRGVAAEEYEAAARERARKREEADKRATRLLRDVLSPEQRETFAREGWFEVRVGSRVFRIANAGAQNVNEMENGRPIRNYCIVPQGVMPLADILVAQKMLLEADLEQFERIAVKQEFVRVPQRPQPNVNGAFELTFTATGWIVGCAVAGVAMGVALSTLMTR